MNSAPKRVSANDGAPAGGGPPSGSPGRRDALPADGWGHVLLPAPLDRNYPNAPRQRRWRWGFPQEDRWQNPKTGEPGRRHAHESLIQNAVAGTVKGASLPKLATCHADRHAVDTPLLASGCDIPVCTCLSAGGRQAQRTGRRMLQELRGHNDVKTTMICSHVVNRGDQGLKSPVDDWQREGKAVLYRNQPFPRDGR